MPQYLPSTSGDVRDVHDIARGMVRLGNIATVFTTDAGSEDAISSRGGIIVEKSAEVIDGVEVRRYPIDFRFLSAFKFLVDRKRFVDDSTKLDGGFQQQKAFYQYPWLQRFRPPICVKLRQAVLQAREYDIYHVNGICFSHAVYAYQASLKNRIPLVIRPAFHAMDRLYYNSLNIQILKHAQVILANTKAEAEIFAKFGIDTAKITVVGCGVNLREHSNVSRHEVQEFRARHDFSSYESTVLFLSRLQKEKGVFQTIESIIKLNNRQRVQLLVAGSDYNGNSQIVQELSKRYHFVSYLGRISEKEKAVALQACDLLVVPSIVDSFGIVYIEAWAHQKPVIGADIPSTKTLIDYGYDGYYVNCQDVTGLAEKIAELTSQPEKRSLLGEGGYRKVTANYTDEIVFQKVYQKYEEIVSSR